MMPQRICPTKALLSAYNGLTVPPLHSLHTQAQNTAVANDAAVNADIAGFVVASLLGAFAYIRSRRPGGFYDREIYGMIPRTHRTYAAISLLFALAFGVSARWFADVATVWLYAAFVLFGIFYLTSYLRGAQEDDE